MGKGIGVPFVADVSEFISGTTKIETALDGVVSALDDVGDEGKLVETDLKRNMDDIGDKADTVADGIKADFKTALEGVSAKAKTEGRKTSTNLDTEVGKTKGKFKILGGDLGSELTANIGEGVSAGSVKMQDAVLGTLGGTLAGASQLFGPLFGGLAIGGVVVTQIIKGIVDNQESVRLAVQQSMSDAVDAAADWFDDGKKSRSLGEIIKGFTPEEKQAFKDSSIDLYEAAAAIKTYEDTGDRSKIDALTKPIKDRTAAINDLGMAHTDFLTGESTGPGLFDVGGPLIGDAAAAAALDKYTGLIEDRTQAYIDLQNAALKVDIDRVRKINAELGRPVYGSPTGNRRWTN